MRTVVGYWMALVLVVGVIAGAAAWGQPEARVVHRACAAHPLPDVVTVGDRVYRGYQLSATDWRGRLAPVPTGDRILGHTSCPTQVVALRPLRGIGLDVALAPDDPDVVYVTNPTLLDRALGLQQPPLG